MLTQHQKSRSNQPAASPVDAFVQGSLPQKAVAKLCRVSTVIHSSISSLILLTFPKYCDINRRTTTAGGSLSPYCSTECAELARARMPARVHPRYSVNVAPFKENLCAVYIFNTVNVAVVILLIYVCVYLQVCGEHPRLRVNGGAKVYEFCSRACADTANSQHPDTLQTSRVHGKNGEVIEALLEHVPLRFKCALPGCSLRPENNEAGGYCSKGHRE